MYRFVCASMNVHTDIDKDTHTLLHIHKHSIHKRIFAHVYICATMCIYVNMLTDAGTIIYIYILAEVPSVTQNTHFVKQNFIL